MCANTATTIRDKLGERDFIEKPLGTSDILLLLMCFFLLDKIIKNSILPGMGATSILVNFLGFLAVFSGIIMILSDIDTDKYVKIIAVVFLILILISSVSGNNLRTSVKSDVSAFSVYSAELFLQGENPYNNSMTPSLEMFDGVDRATPLMSGDEVDSLSYPAMSFLFLVPQVYLGIYNPFYTSIIFVLITSYLLVIDIPSEYSLAGVFSIHFLLNSISFSTTGFAWILSLLLGIRFWQQNRYLSLFFIGLSFSFKQIPWFTAPFLIIWILKENKKTKKSLLNVFKQLGFLATVFLIPNLPFILNNHIAWLKGVFTPMSSTGELIQLGEGLVQISLKLGYLPNSFFTAMMVLFTIFSMSIYWIYFNRLKWIAWIMPSLILWFNYRSAAKYMIAAIPIIMYSYATKEALQK